MLIEAKKYLYIYVVRRDFGFAPNPFHGVCTLATCKPDIRRSAQVGDWVMGVGGVRLKAMGKCLYLMKVTEMSTFDDYWSPWGSQREALPRGSFVVNVSRSTLADANENRDWRIYADFAQLLIHQARTLYLKEDFGVQLNKTIYALDSSTIDLCLSLFPWAWFRKTKAVIKLHTLLDLHEASLLLSRSQRPSCMMSISLSALVPEPGAIYVMDRGYLDFERLYALHQAPAFFVTRSKSNTDLRRLYSNPVDKDR